MAKINITVNGREYEVETGQTVLKALRSINVHVPTLCYLEKINEIASCRLCLVKVEGVDLLQTACTYPVKKGMVIDTQSEEVLEARKINLQLILSNHDKKCLTCSRLGNCELIKVSNELGIEETPFEGENHKYDIDDTGVAIVRDNNKCILCRRCTAVCADVQKIEAIKVKGTGFDAYIGTENDVPLEETNCITCGQCIVCCPTGALKEKDETHKVWDALSDKTKHVVVQTAPAVRVSLGEEFGMPVGSIVTGKMVTALKRLGFDKVFDTNTGADITIMEEANELLDRINNKGVLPMFTSCSPGWVKYCEHNYPEFIPNLSSCKSPQAMLGAMLKSYYPQKVGIDPKDVYVVSVMPCTAKKFENSRPEIEVDELRDVDATITTRELAKMIRKAGIDFSYLEDSEFDTPLGLSTGAGAIFGSTGGVMEAALRTAAEIIKGERIEEVEYEVCRGEDGIKEFTVELSGVNLKGCVVQGTGSARRLLERIKRKQVTYDFVEIMGCVGGCVMGGGQPIRTAKERMAVNVFEKRSNSIYNIDKSLPLRRSNESPVIHELYKDFLGEPGGHEAHKYLHTKFVSRKVEK